MTDVCSNIMKFMSTAEENSSKAKMSLFKYLCKGFGIINGNTDKAVFLRNKFEEGLQELDSSDVLQIKEYQKIAFLMRSCIDAVTENPSIDFPRVKTLKGLLKAFSQVSKEEPCLFPLPDNFLEKVFHREGAATKAVAPSVYYRDGVLISEAGVTQSESVWEDTGVMIMHSWKVFNDFAQATSLASERTNAFGMQGRTKYSLMDMQDAFSRLSAAKVSIKPNMAIVLRKSSKRLKTSKVTVNGQVQQVTFNRAGIGNATFTDPVSGRVMKAAVVNLYGRV